MRVNISDKIQSRTNNFDFIRFLAALVVIFSHSYDLTGDKSSDPLKIFSRGYFTLGTLAVIVFFVISGFLITNSYQKSASLGQYFTSRAFRIYPALVVTTLLTVFVIGPLITHDSLGAYFESRETFVYLLNTVSIKINYLLPGVFPANPVIRIVNGSLWSLPYELSCYCLVAFVGQILNKKLFLALAALVPVALIYCFIDKSQFGNVFEYTSYFAVGGLICLFKDKIRISYLMTLLCLVAWIGVIAGPFGNHIKFVASLITLPYIIITVGYVKSWFNNFAKRGDFSYGLYIWAWVIQQIISERYSSFTSYTNFIFSALCSLVLAFLSWHLIEKRILSLKKTILKR